jgi:hypothetical protein
MYSFLPKVTQQLKQLSQSPYVIKNPYRYSANPYQQPDGPQGPGDIYKNLIDENGQDSYYRKYNNEWTIYDNDEQGWKSLPQSYPDMLNNRITTDKGKQALYRQGNPEAIANAPVVNAPMYNPTQGLNMPQIPERVSSVGNNSVLASNSPEPNVFTPELDLLMGNAETPYVMDYAPFSSEEEMHKFYNPANNMPLPGLKQYPAFHGEYEKAREQAKKEYKQTTNASNYVKNWMGELFDPNRKKRVGDAGDDGDISNVRADYDGDISNVRANYDGNISNVDPNKKNKFGLAEGYYLGNAMLNASAAINNMVQPEPPSIQMKIPHFERQRLNPEPYDNMRSQVRDQGTQAYRLQRENISQASDLMKGLAAVTSGTQQGLMNVGLQQATADQQIQGINQQISMQEQGLQTDTLNKEAITNWQIQDEFYKTKGQAISSALAGLSQTGGQYAKYKSMQDMVEKQDAINKSAAEVNNEMQASLLEYELSETALSSQEYQDYYKSQRKTEQDRINKELLGDEKYKALSDYNNGVLPSYSSYQYNIDSPESQEKLRTINVAKRFQSEYPLGAAPDIAKFPNDKDGYDRAVAEYNKYKTYNDRYLNDPRYKAYEAEQAFWNEALEKFNESSLKKSTAETYLKSRGLTTQTDLLQRLKAISERGSQIVG